MLQLNDFIFPLFSAAQGKDMLRVKRFIGCGFWLDQYGHFATCKHVLDLVPEGQGPVIAQPGTDRSDHFYPVQNSVAHANFDLAVGCASPKAVGAVLPRYTGPTGLGLDVQAFGYTDSGKEGASYNVDPRLLRGHVVRMAESAFGLPSPSLLEVSFGSPSGFSGTPLLVDSAVVGILYSNLDSKLEAYSIEEVADGESKYREVAYRIYEYGIAHRIADFEQFFAECGVGRGQEI